MARPGHASCSSQHEGGSAATHLTNHETCPRQRTFKYLLFPAHLMKLTNSASIVRIDEEGERWHEEDVERHGLSEGDGLQSNEQICHRIWGEIKATFTPQLKVTQFIFSPFIFDTVWMFLAQCEQQKHMESHLFSSNLDHIEYVQYMVLNLMPSYATCVWTLNWIVQCLTWFLQVVSCNNFVLPTGQMQHSSCCIPLRH